MTITKTITTCTTITFTGTETTMPCPCEKVQAKFQTVAETSFNITLYIEIQVGGSKYGGLGGDIIEP